MTSGHYLTTRLLGIKVFFIVLACTFSEILTVSKLRHPLFSFRMVRFLPSAPRPKRPAVAFQRFVLIDGWDRRLHRWGAVSPRRPEPSLHRSSSMDARQTRPFGLKQWRADCPATSERRRLWTLRRDELDFPFRTLRLMVYWMMRPFCELIRIRTNRSPCAPFASFA